MRGVREKRAYLPLAEVISDKKQVISDKRLDPEPSSGQEENGKINVKKSVDKDLMQ